MPKNLVVIVLDTLRHPKFFPGLDDGSAMPYFRSLEPSGLSFSNLIASSCWTPPSHVSLLSGTDPWNTHFHIASGTSHVPTAPFLADRWHSLGGESAAFSANWLVAPEVGTARGYDTFNPGLPTSLSGLALQGVQVAGFEQLMFSRIARSPCDATGRTRGLLDRSIQIFGTAFHRSIRPLYSGLRVVRAMNRFLRLRSDRRPLHLFLNLMEMHEPYPSPGGRRGGGLDLQYLPSVNLARHTQALERWGEALGMMEPYRLAARNLDSALRSAVESLRKAGVLDDAALLVTSDHGQGLGEHGGFFGHAFFLHDELVRIPAVYLEFEHGQPKLDAGRYDGVFDLRHLFDLLIDRSVEVRPVAPDRSIPASVARRGPAASFWEGPRPHPPRGFLLSPPPSAYHRAVRVFGEEGILALDSDGTTVFEGAASSPSELLVASAETAIGQTGGPARTSPGRRDPEVDKRLKSWGYD